MSTTKIPTTRNWWDFVKKIAEVTEMELYVPSTEVQKCGLDKVQSSLKSDGCFCACGIFNKNPSRYLYLPVDTNMLDSPGRITLPDTVNAQQSMDHCSCGIICDSTNNQPVTFDDVRHMSTQCYTWIHPTFLIPQSTRLRYALIPVFDVFHPSAYTTGRGYTGVVIVPCTVELGNWKP